ncbi:helix-turn-helix transcriptional regulator [Paenibacillus sp. GCM10027626]|uniref:helix-turn-helix transcriptional regulator n=1 Tax=Paenibacillus sp. GCM10027626 TaxID=3273411 RepID=UPI00363F8FCA
MSAAQLAEQLELNVRTIYRYIDALCASGVPIAAEPGRTGGYWIPEDFAEAPLFFDLEEQKALVHAAVFAQEAGYPYGEVLQRAIVKLKRFSSEEQREALNRHAPGIAVIHPPVCTAETALLQELEKAVVNYVTQSLVYQTGYGGAIQTRLVNPYGLVHWKSKWYMVGYCHLRQEVRSFRIDRIKRLSATETSFQRPAHFSARQFLLESLLSHEGENSRISVYIEGSPEAIDNLCRHWLFGHALVERTEYAAEFALDELTLYTQAPYMLLSYGGKLQVTEPEELRELLAEIALALYDMYREPRK